MFYPTPAQLQQTPHTAQNRHARYTLNIIPHPLNISQLQALNIIPPLNITPLALSGAFRYLSLE